MLIIFGPEGECYHYARLYEGEREDLQGLVLSTICGVSVERDTWTVTTEAPEDKRLCRRCEELAEW